MNGIHELVNPSSHVLSLKMWLHTVWCQDGDFLLSLLHLDSILIILRLHVKCYSESYSMRSAHRPDATLHCTLDKVMGV